MTPALLEVVDLKRHFDAPVGAFGRRVPLRAVDGVSFTVSPGRTFGLVGESGCGKTTLARTILRLIEPTAGAVRLDGRDVTSLSRRALKPLRRRMQMVFQDPYASLPPRRTIARSLREPLDAHGVGARRERGARVTELLRMVGLDPAAGERYPHEFSGGQRQRIAIARALALRPRLLVADEAVSSLDVSVKSQVLNLLADLQDRFGLGMVFISHDLAVVQHVADDVGVMYLGRLVETAPVRRMFAMPAHPYTRALLDAVPVPDPQRAPHRGALPGEVPSPAEPPAGCPFHTRCPEAMDVCRRRAPRTIDIGTTEEPHVVRCHLHDPGAGSG
jgi:peptide/nickel transport system ATP-binding protein/oligopeptide transport system ATP-binding protein